MKKLLKTTEPALIVASDRLIDLVDRVIERHSHEESQQESHSSQRRSFPWLCWGVVQRLALNHPAAQA
jgi:hypothetical protein